MLKSALAGSALMLALATGATAAPLLYDIDLIFNQGPLRNQLYEGTFSIEGDGFSGSGTEVFAAAGSEKRLLSFDITVSGDAYSLASVDEPGNTWVTFVDGQFSHVQYLGAAGNSLLAADNTVRFLDTASRTVSTGIYIARPAVIDAPAPVPLPPAALFMASGLGLLLVALWRPRAADQLAA